MPTRNRARFIPSAIKCFLSQDYPELELIIADSGEEEIKHLIPKDERIKYIHSDVPLTTGEARNFGTELAYGKIICNTDDDDWYSKERVSKQVEFHLSSGRSVTGYSYIVMHDLDTDAFNRYTMADPYFCGPSIVYTRDYWVEEKIDPINCDEDWKYVLRASRRNESARNHDDSVITIVARTHAKNTVPRTGLYATPQWITEPRPPEYESHNITNPHK